MKKYKVIFSPQALADLEQLGDYIAEIAGAKIAIEYVSRIENHCQNLNVFPHRGRKRDDLHSSLRIIGHERRVSIAFSVYSDKVIIQSILYGGRDVDSWLADMDM